MAELRSCDCGAAGSVGVEYAEYPARSWAYMLCGACRRRGPFCEVDAEVSRSDTRAAIIVAMAAARDAAIAAAIAGWNARPEEDRLRAALVQARDALLANWHIADMGSRWIADWWQECSRCHGIGPVNDEELSKVVHREDCDRKKLLATLDAALAVKA